MHCSRLHPVTVVLITLTVVYIPIASAEQVSGLLSERGTDFLMSPEVVYDPMPTGTTLPFVVFRQYTDEAEDFLDEVAALIVGTSFSTNGTLDLPQNFTTTMDALGVDTDWDTSDLAPVSEDDRNECNDNATSYEIGLSGTLDDLDDEFNQEEGTLDVYLETYVYLTGNYKKWSFYSHTWSDDFWYCLGHITQCPLNLDNDCEAACGGVYCPWVEVNFWYEADPLMLTYQYEMSYDRGVGTMNFVDTNYHDALNAIIGSFIAGDDPASNPFAVFASPLEMLIDMAVYHDVDGQYAMTLPDSFSDGTVSAEDDAPADAVRDTEAADGWLNVYLE